MAYNEEVTMMMSVVPGAMTGISTMMSGLVSINNVFLDMTRQLDASFGLIDTSIITTATIVAQLGFKAAEAFGEFEQGLKVAQMVSGQTAQEMDLLRQKANEFSVSYRADIDQITEGLQTLGRAGLNSASEQTEVLESGLSTAKLEGRELNSVLEELIQNTALLGGDLKSANFGEDSGYINDLLVATSMTAPITTHDVSETLKYSGGIAAAAGAKIRTDSGEASEQGKAILEDYMGAIAAFAQKGVTGSIAGTALRAFFNKPATQDSSVTEALASIKLKPEYLWEDDEETMKPVSEQIALIQRQMDKLNVSTMDRLQIWSKIVGGKMGQQMMKLESSDIKKLTKDIRSSDDAESLASGTFQTFQSNMKEMTEQGQVAFRQIGQYAAKALTPFVEIITRILEIFSNPVVAFGSFIGGVTLIGMAIQRLKNVYSLLKDEFGQVKRAFLGDEKLYSLRPSIERSMNRKSRGVEKNKELSDYFKTARGEDNIGKAVLKQYQQDIDENLLEKGASPEDLGALYRLKKASLKSGLGIFEEQKINDRISYIRENRDLVGLDKNFKFNGEDMARYALSNNLWNPAYTDYLLNTDTPHSLQEFSKKFGNEFFDKVLGHMESIISKKNIKEGYVDEGSVIGKQVNQLVDLFDITNKRVEGRGTAKRVLNKFFQEQGFTSGEPLSVKQFGKIISKLQETNNVEIPNTFLSRLAYELSPNPEIAYQEKIKQLIKAGRPNEAAALTMPKRKPLSDEEVLKKLVKAGILEETASISEYKGMKKYFEEELPEESNAEVYAFGNKILNKQLGMNRVDFLSSANWDDFVNRITKSIPDKKAKDERIKEIYKAIADSGLSSSDFDSIRNYLIAQAEEEKVFWDDLLAEEKNLKILKQEEGFIPVFKSDLPSYLTRNAMDGYSLLSLREDIESVDMNQNDIIAGRNVLWASQNKEKREEHFSRNAVLRNAYHQFGKFKNMPSTNKDFNNFSMPYEEALYMGSFDPGVDYFKDLQITLANNKKVQLGNYIKSQVRNSEKANKIINDLYIDWLSGLEMRRGDMNRIIDSEILYYKNLVDDSSAVVPRLPGQQPPTPESLEGKKSLKILGQAFGLDIANKDALSKDDKKILSEQISMITESVTEDVLRSLDKKVIKKMNFNELRSLSSVLGIKSSGNSDTLRERLLFSTENPGLFTRGLDSFFANLFDPHYSKEEKKNESKEYWEDLDWEKVNFENVIPQYRELSLEQIKLIELKEKYIELLRIQEELEAKRAELATKTDEAIKSREVLDEKEKKMRTPGDSTYIPHLETSHVMAKRERKAFYAEQNRIYRARSAGARMTDEEKFQNRLERKLLRNKESSVEALIEKHLDNLYYPENDIYGRTSSKSKDAFKRKKEIEELGGLVDKDFFNEFKGAHDIKIEQPVEKTGGNYVWDEDEIKKNKEKESLGRWARTKNWFSNFGSGIGDGIRGFLYKGLEDPKGATRTQKLTASLTNLTNLAGGPLLVAIEAVTIVIQQIQAMYEQYSQETKQLSDAVKNAYSDISSAESGLKQAYREANPGATNEDIENYILDIYGQRYEDFKSGDWVNKSTITGDKKNKEYEYDEEADNGSYKEKEEEEKTAEQNYEEAVKENTGALYAATAQLQTSMSALVTKMNDGVWGIDGLSSKLSDILGKVQDTNFGFGEGSGFVESGGFLLTASQKDSNYAGYTEMSGLMLENFKDNGGNLYSGLNTMLGKDTKNVLSTMNPKAIETLQGLANFSSNKGPGSLTREQNSRLQQSMKNDKKSWQALGKEIAKVDLKKQKGKTVTASDVRRLEGYIKKLATETGLDRTRILQGAALQQLQDMYAVAQQSMVPLAEQQANIAAEHLVTGKVTQGNAEGADYGAQSTASIASAISAMVAVIAQAKAGEAYWQQKKLEGDKDALESATADEYLKKGIGVKQSYRSFIDGVLPGASNYIEGFAKGLGGSIFGTTEEQRVGKVKELLDSNFYSSKGDAKIFKGWMMTLETMGEKARNPSWTDEQAQANAERKLSGYFNSDGSLKYNEDVISKIVRENYADAITPALIEQYMGSDIGEVGEGSGGSGGSGGDSGDKDKGNRKERVDLVLCNKKEIPKLNVNLFKKPPTFTVLNKNFKVRDVKINTEDTPKAIMSSIKNAFIDVQKRSDPKIIQDESAEYDPVAATDGNSLPSGTSKPNTS